MVDGRCLPKIQIAWLFGQLCNTLLLISPIPYVSKVKCHISIFIIAIDRSTTEVGNLKLRHANLQNKMI